MDEVNALVCAGSIVAVRDEVVSEHRAAQQLHRCVLLRPGQRGEAFGMGFATIPH
ncbi:hypothetical protein [Steroidobacter agaridevorans]|uniref:hypothetical protein n=1 Tax=Steroidobacter agaridevorans TaxID=2695856 RepID=UPI00137AC70A|nr:hypothetical protein [Steroidobacter agaridevorans]